MIDGWEQLYEQVLTEAWKRVHEPNRVVQIEGHPVPLVVLFDECLYGTTVVGGVDQDGG